MSAFPSDYLDDNVLNLIFRNTAWTPPTSLYLALFTSNPGPTGSGTEVSGGSYARQTITFAVSSGGTIASNAAVTFSALSSAVITHYGVFSAATAGNLIVYGQLPSSVSANTGDDLTIASGGITFSLSGS